MARDFVQRFHQPTIAAVVVSDTPPTCEYCAKPLPDDLKANARFCNGLCRSRKYYGRTLTGGRRNHSGKE